MGKSNDYNLTNTDLLLAKRLQDTQEDAQVHFQYERETFIIIYGPNETEGYVGKGRTLGQALQNLIDNMTREDLEESGALS